MKLTELNLQRTRHAILDALAHCVVESKGFGFTVQEVADRAGVTHRTVYNHFPTREAMREALATYTEEMLSVLGPPPDENLTLDVFPGAVRDLYLGTTTQEVHIRAYVMLMIASRGAAAVAAKRTRQIEALLARDAALPPNLSAAQVAAALRMFGSSLGWHLLTDHFGLSTEDAAGTATWAMQTLSNAVKPKTRARSAPAEKRAKKKKPAHGNERRRA